ncbi:MAG: 23S rRNA (pseudouridine(1915)-N(3))-methyltransferase RlmH, partial [Pseudomonadota bacterium]
MKSLLVFAVGRLKDRNLEKNCDEYFKRCSRTVTINVREMRNLDELKKTLPSRVFLVALDERGQEFTSREFAQKLTNWLVAAPQVAFIIGGADGLDDEIRERSDVLL